MYGTIARLTAASPEGALGAEMDRQMREDRPAGLVGMWIFRMDADPDEYLLAVAFESREAYEANAASAEQAARYGKLRALLGADPEWHDGEIVSAAG